MPITPSIAARWLPKTSSAAWRPTSKGWRRTAESPWFFRGAEGVWADPHLLQRALANLLANAGATRYRDPPC